MGASVTTVSRWLRVGEGELERMRAMSAWRTSGRVATIAASTIALDKMWTYWGARKAEKRNELWGWTAAVEERDGSRMDFEVGGRDDAAFLRLTGAAAGCGALRDRRIRSVWALPVSKHVVGKYGAVNWNEGLHSMPRGKLNRLAHRAKGCAKSVAMPVNLLALVFCDKLKLNATHR